MAHKTLLTRITLTLSAIAIAFLLLRPALAQSGNQWRIDYFNNPNWAGAPVYTQFTYTANMNWGTGSPGPKCACRQLHRPFYDDTLFLFRCLSLHHHRRR